MIDAVMMRQIGDQLIEVTERHDRLSHGGDPCMKERVNAVAFLAHCVGLAAAHGRFVAERLWLYEMACPQRHDPGQACRELAAELPAPEEPGT